MIIANVSIFLLGFRGSIDGTIILGTIMNSLFVQFPQRSVFSAGKQLLRANAISKPLRGDNGFLFLSFSSEWGSKNARYTYCSDPIQMSLKPCPHAYLCNDDIRIFGIERKLQFYSRLGLGSIIQIELIY